MNYQTILESVNLKINKQKSNSAKISLVRILLALVSIFFLYQILKNGYSITWLMITLVSFFLFLFFVHFHQKLKAKIHYNETKSEICQNERLAEQGISTQFGDGSKYADKEHPFSFDLDIFGEKSIFQLLNRTFTEGGENTLAEQIKFPCLEVNKITSRQEAVQELAKKIEWRVDFLTIGNLLSEDTEKFKALNLWLSNVPLATFDKYKLLLWFVPIANLFTLLLFSFGIISYKIWLFTLLIQSGFGVFNWRKMNELYLKSSKNTPYLEKYSHLFKHLETGNFDSQLLIKWQSILQNNGNISEKIQQLVIIGKYFSLRNNPFGPLLNTFFLWDYQCAYRFEKWKKENSSYVLQAFEVLNEFEALLSISCFAYANPDYVLPEISNILALQTQKIGHPLLKKEINVPNDFQIIDKEQIYIVTGANMAGKSTFLRAVGANMVLAMIGAPVCAEKFIFKPIQIFTCMRITDSIGEGESYFHAELSRLSKIVNLLEQGKEVFVILDELLKGTNSKDKLLGSELFLEKLLQYKTVLGLIATHDLDLTKISIKYPEAIKNICFEVLINADKMTFDYKLRQGVTQNMNALFLMKQMGIIN